MGSKLESYPSFFSEPSRCGTCDDVRDRGGWPWTAPGGVTSTPVLETTG